VGAGGTAILVEESVAATGRTEPPASRLFEPEADPGGVSLEDSILRVWEDLTGSGGAECPVCGGRMRASAACGGCGSELG
jgi:hypothetical protein